MGVVMQERQYGWATQSDYQTAKTPGSNAFKKMIVTDTNFIEHSPATQNDDGWSHGYNTPTEQWLESHDNNISHSMPGYIEEMPRVFKGALGGYVVSTPSGGTDSKLHTIKPLAPSVSRQLQAISYIEKIGGHDIMAPGMIFESFSLQGSDQGLLMLDFALRGSGEIKASGVTWSSGVQVQSGLHKLFNTQIAVELTPDGGSPVALGCTYRSFNLSVQNELLDAAGYKPGCNRYQSSGNNQSGAIRSELLLNKQNITFSFVCDIGSTALGFAELVAQTPMAIELEAVGGIIEGAIARSLKATMGKVYYTARQIGESNGLATYEITGTVMTDISTGDSLILEVTNDVATYATW